MVDNARNFGAREAAQLLGNLIPSTGVSAELPTDQTSTLQPAAELPFFLEQAANQPGTAALFIINGKTISFVPQASGHILWNSHLHESPGAVIAYAKEGDLWNLLQFYHKLTGFPYTLGTVTTVSF